MADRQNRTGSFSAECASCTWATLRPASKDGGVCSPPQFAVIPRIDFILLAGDLVDRGNERSNWDHFFLRAAGVFDRIPLMPCVGNHEYLDMGPRLYRAFFELPQNGPAGIAAGLVYHFESGDACFAVLDSTLAAYDPSQARSPGRLAGRDARANQATWKFVMFHHPIYPSHPWRDTPALREHLVPDLRQAPRRFRPARTRPRLPEDLPAAWRITAPWTPADGTIYLMAVSGDKFVDQTAPRLRRSRPQRRFNLSDLRDRCPSRTV